MTSPVARKLGMKPGMQALIIAPPSDYLKLLAPLPEGLTVSSLADGMYPFVQVFATRLSDISKCAQRLSKHAARTRWCGSPTRRKHPGTPANSVAT
jgi:hypothetical protein